MPSLDTVWQWDRFQEPIYGQHPPTTGHLSHLSALYHPQINGKWEVFHKDLKPTLKKLCKNDADNWDKYINQALVKYCVTPHLTTMGTWFFLAYGRDPNLPIHPLLEPMLWFLGDPEPGCLNLKSHCLALVMAKKTLDENRFKHVQKTTDHTPPNFKIGNRVYFRNKQPSKWVVCIEHKDTTAIQKTKLQEKLDPAMPRTLCTGCHLSFEILTLNLEELESLHTIQQISPLYP